VFTEIRELRGNIGWLTSASPPETPQDLIVFNGALYFGGGTDNNGSDLGSFTQIWKSDGSTGSTPTQVTTTTPSGNYQGNLTPATTALYYLGESNVPNAGVWTSDGTVGSGTLVDSTNNGGAENQLLVLDAVNDSAVYLAGTTLASFDIHAAKGSTVTATGIDRRHVCGMLHLSWGSERVNCL